MKSPEVHRGRDRSVLIVGSVAFKFAQIHPFSAAELAVHHFRLAGINGLKRSCAISASSHQSIQALLGKGVLSNRTEVILANRYPDLVISTRGCLGGAVNIQPSVETLGARLDDSRWNDVREVFVEHLGLRKNSTGIWSCTP